MPCRIVITLLVVAALFLVRCSWKKPSNVGLVNGTLHGCPRSPNCVSSLAGDTSHSIAPLSFTGTAEDARKRIAAVVASMPRARIVEDTGTYLRAEYASALFRFVDDVEFLVDAPSGRVHVRSASRVGYSDLGVNRKRVEEIRRLFEGAGGR